MIHRAVFIPTRGRYRDIGKLCDVWQNKNFDVHHMVEPQEAEMYDRNVPAGTHCHVLDHSNAGVAYSRAQCVNLARRYGFKSMLLADDDIKPSTRRPDGMAEILEACQHPKILGMTARYSYHDLCLGPDIKCMDDIILLSTGTFRLVGLNVDNVFELGNYDTLLEYGEDCDLFLRGLKAGFPWMVHLGSFSNSIGTRYQPGGMTDFVKANGWDLAGCKAEWHIDLWERYPDIINKHTDKCKGKQNCISIQWKRAYDRYMPGWRKWSALDGGDLQEYIDG